MWVRDDIDEVIARTGVRAHALAPDVVQSVLSQLDQRFAAPGCKPLWERFVDSTSVHDPEGWRALESRVQAPPLLLVQDSQGSCGYRFDNATDLVRTLAECYGFAFYVTDPTGRYALAFNDHDVLIGVGEAATWIRDLGSSRSS